MFVNVGKGNDHCPHEHETWDDAQKCLTEYTQELRKLGKVCDRIIVETDSIEQLEDDLTFY